MVARAENDFDFYSRRALEEARAAAKAASVVVGAAHRHMAAVYAARVQEEYEAAQMIDDVETEDDPALDDPAFDDVGEYEEDARQA